MIEGLESRQLLAVAVWDGGGASDYWQEAGNWVGDVRPNSGDHLVFPASALSLDSINNFTGFRASSITIEGDGYQIQGNPIDLSGDLVVEGNGNSFQLGTRLVGTWATSILVQSASLDSVQFNFFADINLNGRELSIAATSSSRLNLMGDIFGVGDVVVPDLEGGEVKVAGMHNYSGAFMVQGGGRVALDGYYPELTVESEGTLEIGGFAAGEFSSILVGFLDLQAGSSTMIDIDAVSSEVLSDLLSVEGTAFLDGELTIRNLAGGSLQRDQSASFLSFGNRIGNFSHVVLPLHPLTGEDEIEIQFHSDSLEAQGRYLYVTNTDDNGYGSLRSAISRANGLPGEDRIFFEIPMVGAPLITPETNLPSIVDTLRLDGRNVYAGASAITQLSGGVLSDPWSVGLGVEAADTSIHAMSIGGFQTGVALRSLNGTITGSYIGLTADGTARGNATGVLVQGSGNIVGAMNTGMRNVISQNSASGISVTGLMASDNAIAGNYIGTDPDGVTALPNLIGVRVEGGAQGTVIGAPHTGSSGFFSNLISGNAHHAIAVYGSTTIDTTIESNWIGVDVSGNSPLANGASGIQAEQNPVGLTIRSNVVSGNASGMGLMGVANLLVAGNKVGVGADGMSLLGNSGAGIFAAFSSGLQIGGTTVADRNVIGGNGGRGIWIDHGGASGGVIQGNYVGVAADGTTAAGNWGTGIAIIDSPAITVGGSVSGAGNVIAGNDKGGVLVVGTASTSVSVEANRIGTNAAGTDALGNNQFGVFVGDGDAILVPSTPATGVRIGGEYPESRNLISGNQGPGVWILGAGANSNSILGNYIGTNASGTASLANYDGVVVEGDATGNLIGKGDGAYQVPNGDFEAAPILGAGQSGISIGNSKWTTTAPSGPLYVHSISGVSGWIYSTAEAGGTHTDIGLARRNGSMDRSATGQSLYSNRWGQLITSTMPNKLEAGVTVTATIDFGTLGSATDSGRGSYFYLVAGEANPSNLNNFSSRSIILSQATAANPSWTGFVPTVVVPVSSYGTVTLSYTFAENDPALLLPLTIGMKLAHGSVGAGYYDDVKVTYSKSSGIGSLAGNLIAGNANHGVRIGAQANGNLVQGNWIGINRVGDMSLGQGGHGVFLEGFNNIVGVYGDGSRDASEGNLISGSAYAGVLAYGGSGNQVAGNRVGTNALGTAAIANGDHGVHVLGGANNLIGTNGDGVADTLERNLLSGNTGSGVLLNWTSSNRVAGNFLGTKSDGMAAVPNTGNGIYVAGRSWNNILGTDSSNDAWNASERNLISGNSNYGIQVWGGDGAKGTVIAGNWIGLNATGNVALANSNHGVLLEKTTESRVGTNGDGFADDLERNVVSGNAGNQITVNTGTPIVYGLPVVDKLISGEIPSIQSTGTIDQADLADFTWPATGYWGYNHPIPGGGGDQYAIKVTGTIEVLVSRSYLFALGGDDGGRLKIGSEPVINDDSLHAFDVRYGEVFLSAGMHPFEWVGFERDGAAGFELSAIVDGWWKVLGDPDPHAEIRLQSGTNMSVTTYQVAGSEKSNTLIAGNYIGTNATGNGTFPNDGGISVSFSREVTIGGANPGMGNVVSGTAQIRIDDYQGQSSDIIVQGNIVGLDATGTNALGSNGVQLVNVARARVQGNVISGGTGLAINQGSDSRVIGNFIGLASDGLTSKPNTGHGVSVSNASNIVIGTDGDGVTDLAERNFIAGNSASGISLQGSSGVTISGNTIGLATDGTIRANSQNGIYISGSSGTVVGTDGDGLNDALEGNVISGNSHHGIYVLSASTGSRIAGNLIGTNPAGDAARANGMSGVAIYSASTGNVVGSNGDGVSDLLERNVISGNVSSGVYLHGAGTNNNVVAGNLIGLNSSGSAAIANAQGVFIEGTASGNRIGTNGDGVGDFAERNVISGNTTRGVLIASAGSNSNTIAGNYIGTDASGMNAVPNVTYGVELQSGVSFTTIGGPTAAYRNIISGNTSNGVHLTTANDNTVSMNYIGVGSDGLKRLGNLSGISAGSSTSRTRAIGNVLSGNRGSGIVISGGSGSELQGNIVGLASDGVTLVGNNSYGVLLQGGAQEFLVGTNGDGTSDANEGNTIAGNTYANLYILTAWTNLRVAGNRIGTDITGEIPIAHIDGVDGIAAVGMWNLTIGTNGSNDAYNLSESNIIGGNTGYGIRLVGRVNELSDDVVAGNFVGVSPNGNPIPNKFGGIYVSMAAPGVRIGTDGNGVADAMERNVISGNGGYGISFDSNQATNTVIAGNLLGLKPDGVEVAGNALGGIRLSKGSTARVGSNSDGQSDALERNLISGNLGPGIRIESGMTELGTMTQVDQVIAGTIPSTQSTHTISQTDFLDPLIPYSGYHSYNNTLPTATGDDYVVVVTGTVQVLTAGTYSYAFSGGGRLKVDGSQVSASTSSPDIDSLFLRGNGILSVGLHTFEWTYFQRGGAGGGEYVVAEGVNTTPLTEANGWRVLGASNPTANIRLAPGTMMTAKVYKLTQGVAASNHTIAGNWIGVDQTGTLARPNVGDGIYLGPNTSGMTVGGNSSIAGNLVSSNSGAGIHFVGSTNGQVRNNIVGLDSSGMVALGQIGDGILLEAGANGSVVDANWSAGNLAGIKVNGVSDTVLTGNVVGLAIDGATVRGNSEGGIWLTGDGNTRVGTNGDGVDDASERNTLAGNSFANLRVTNNGQARISGNYIGLSTSGTPVANVPPDSSGIYLRGATDIVIGTNSSSDAFNGSERNVIAGNTGKGIWAHGLSNGVVAGNWIGIGPAGGSGLPYANQQGAVLEPRYVDGSLVSPGPDVLVGSNGDGVYDDFERNLISNNRQDGVVVVESSSSIRGNYIGTDPDGLASMPNGGSGVVLSIGYNNQISRNLISGNGEDGLAIDQSESVTVQGNLIGTTADGLSALPNAGHSLAVYQSDDLLIGSPSVADRNVIAYGTGSGILVVDGGSMGSRIQGNYIGLDASGLTDAGNARYGIEVIDSPAIAIGGSVAGEGNLISGNDLGGIAMMGSSTLHGSIHGNWIGLDKSGLAAIPNQSFGIFIGSGALIGAPLLGSARQTLVGSSSPGGRNIISGNNGPGIWLGGEGAGGNTVAGNWIGTNVLGLGSVPNTHGVLLSHGSDGNMIGGSFAGDRNVISGNSQSGVYAVGLFPLENYVTNNWIGLDSSGAARLANARYGIELTSVEGFWVLGNVVSGNTLGGILLQNTTRTWLEGNSVGTDGSGLQSVGNGTQTSPADGVLIVDSSQNRVGGPESSQRNVLSGNTGSGLRISGSSTANVVEGNVFGADRTGMMSVSNTAHGLVIDTGVVGNLVGSNTRDSRANLFYYNLGSGVWLPGVGPSAHNTIAGNLYRGNLQMAIDHGAEGPTANDAPDSDGLANAPVITSAYLATAGLLVLEGTSNPGQIIQFYLSAPTTNGRGQGTRKLYQGVESLAADDTDPVVGIFRFEVPLGSTPIVEFGDLLTSVAINPTSEFGNTKTIGNVASQQAPIVTLWTKPEEAITSLIAGETLNFTGSFADSDSTRWSATVDYGDGSATEILTLSGQQSFTLHHRYPKASPVGSPYTVVVRVTDNSGLVGVASFTLDVINQAPVLNPGDVRITSHLSEGGTATLTGSFTDTSDQEAHTVEIDWGDGTTQILALDKGATNFSVPHIYADDNPTNSARDNYVVRVRVVDEAGAVSAETAVMVTEVSNSLPSGLTLDLPGLSLVGGVAEVSEGDLMSLRIDFSDLGLADSHAIQVDWGDGTAAEVYSLAQAPGQLATRQLDVSHRYRSSPEPLGSSFTILVRVADDDQPLDSIEQSIDVRVVNSLPIITSLELAATTINEGGTASLTVRYSDAGVGDSHRIFVDWGDGTQEVMLTAGAGGSSLVGITHEYRDDQQPYTIAVSILDQKMELSDKPSTLQTTAITVNNVAPQITLPLQRFVQSAPGVWDPVVGLWQIQEGQKVRVTGSYTDVSSVDSHAVSVLWASGEMTEASVNQIDRTFSATYVYRDDYAPGTAFDVETIRVTVTDDDGGSSVDESTQVTVTNVAPDAMFVPLETSGGGSLPSGPGGGPGAVVGDKPVTFQAIVTDPGEENFLYQWEAKVVGATVAVQTGSAETFTLLPELYSGTIEVTLKVDDGDLGVDTYVSTLLLGSENNDAFRVTIDDFVEGIGNLTVITFGGSDVVDATGLPAGFNVVLDGGEGQDFLFGGAGNDTFILRSGNDTANDASNAPAGVTVVEEGDDQYILSPNSVLTIRDTSGANTLNFTRANISTADFPDLGITFDLAASNSHYVTNKDGGLVVYLETDVAPDLGLASDGDPSTSPHLLRTWGIFASIFGSRFNDSFTTHSNTTILGGDGKDEIVIEPGSSGAEALRGYFNGGADADTFVIRSGTLGDISFEGDSGMDVFDIEGGILTGIDFGGGADADTFVIRSGNLTDIDFGGGADADTFILRGTITLGDISFEGDSGMDDFVVYDRVIGNINFGGGADGDTLTLTGSADVDSISFEGDSGADTFVLDGRVTGNIDFGGGADGDTLTLSASATAGGISFEGDSGMDILEIRGTVTGGIDFGGGADADTLLLTVNASAGGISFEGDSGMDILEIRGTITGGIDFGGGADADTLTLLGTVTGGIDFGGGADADTLLLTVNASAGGISFEGDSGMDILEIRGTVTGGIDFGGGADADTFVLTANAAAGSISFEGDSGADTFILDGRVTGNIDFGGGADADTLQLSASAVAGSISFEGDSGADIFILSGTVTGGIDFGGGADADTLLLTTTAAGGSIRFEGDSGADTLELRGIIAGGIDFGGGADADTLILTATASAGSISFEGDFDPLTPNPQGDSGADALIIRGTVLGDIDFGGGADADTLLLTATASAGKIDFEGDQGDDRFQNLAHVSSILFQGGEGKDTFRNDGSNIASIIFYGYGSPTYLGNEGLDQDDVFVNYGSGIASLQFYGAGGRDVLMSDGDDIAAVYFRGGADADTLVLDGRNIGHIDFGGGADADTLTLTGTRFGDIDFEGDTAWEEAGSDRFLNQATGLLDSGGNPLSSIRFLGLGGEDIFRNAGGDWASVVFLGGVGQDRFLNEAEGLGQVTFDGGDDGDYFENEADDLSSVVVLGGAGNDLAVNDGQRVSNFIFFGGLGDDQLLNTGTDTASFLMVETSGTNVMANSGLRASGYRMQGGSDSDALHNYGAGASSWVLYGNAGSDRLINHSGGSGSSDLSLIDSGAIGAIQWPYTGLPPITLPEIPSATSDDATDLFGNRGSDVAKLIFYGGGGNDFFQNSGSGVSAVTFHGGAGNDSALNDAFGYKFTNFTFEGGNGTDAFQNDGAEANLLRFTGGAGNDSFYQNGNNTGSIYFDAGDGSNVYVNWGSGGQVHSMAGGANDDRFQNNADSVVLLEFNGGGGTDALQNNGTGVQTIAMDGGDGDDTIFNSGHEVGWIDFSGGAGNDSLVNAGSALGANAVSGTPSKGVRFFGGEGADVLRTQGIGLSTLVFDGGAGADALVYNTTDGGSIQYTGDSGDDGFVFRGSAQWIAVDLGIGNDSFAYAGAAPHDGPSASVQLTGGVGDDDYRWIGEPSGWVGIVELPEATLDTSRDRIDFSSYTVGGVVFDMMSTASQQIASGFAIQLSADSVQGFESIAGSRFSDTLLGNDRDNRMEGGLYSTRTFSPAVASRNATQWVLLDFASKTDATKEFTYEAADQAAVIDGLKRSYYGIKPDGSIREYSDPSRWFDVRFTTNVNEIPSGMDYVTIYFNETPPNGSPGGLASEIDLGNINLGGEAVVQVHGLLGGTVLAPRLSVTPTEIEGDFLNAPADGHLTYGQRNPDNNVENFIALSVKIAAHELGHLLGLRHYDAFGPIGSGVHTPPGSSAFNPAFTGLSEAYETFQHLISSPAAVGSDRKNDINKLFFGEREAIKLAYGQSDPAIVRIPESASDKSSLVNAQPMEWSVLTMPNTLSSGANIGIQLYAELFSVVGKIELDVSTGRSESDYYAFDAQEGDLLTIEVASRALRRYSNPGGSTTLVPGSFIDPILRVRDASGMVIPYYASVAENDDEFESGDAILIDLKIPSTGTYYIEIDTFKKATGDVVINDFTGWPAELVQIYQDSVNDTDIGNYELLAYRFERANAFDSFNTMQGRLGVDAFVGTAEEDYSLTVPSSSIPVGVITGEKPDYSVTIPFVDAGGAVWTATVDFGDGTGSQIASGFNPSTGLSLSHAFVDQGTYTVRFSTGNDDGKSSGIHSFQVVVTNSAPIASIAVSNAFEGGWTKIDLTATDSPGDIAAGLRYFFTQTASERNGVSYDSASASSASSTSFFHDDDGNYTVYVRVMDRDGGITDYDYIYSVASVAPTASPSQTGPIVEGGSVLVSLDAATDPSLADRTAGLRYGFAKTLAELPVNYVSASESSSASILFRDDGDFAVFARVIDKDGGHTDYTIPVVVNNADPVISSITATSPWLNGSSGQFFVAASDAGVDDILVYDYRIYQGSALVAEFLGQGSSQTWTPSSVGDYEVRVVVSDGDGGASTESAETFRVSSPINLLMQGPADGYQGVSGQERIFRFTSDHPTESMLKYTIDWGDGTAPETMMAPLVTTVAHVFPTTGAFQPVVEVEDSNGDRVSYTMPSFNILRSETQGAKLAIGLNDGGSDDDHISVLHLGGNLFRLTLNGVVLGSGSMAHPGNLELHGGGGSNRFDLLGSSVADIFRINESSIQLKLGSGYSFTPRGISNRSVMGGAGNDQFELVQAAPVAIVGGTGVDQIRSVEAVESHQWRVDSANGGQVRVGTGSWTTNFTEVETLVGADGVVDNFSLIGSGSLSGSLFGGSGTQRDLLDLSQLTGATSVLAGVFKATGITGTWNSIEAFTATNGTFTGANETTDWTISGLMTSQVVSATRDLVLQGFSTLTGGTGTDNFIVQPNGRVSTILGGSGIDTLYGPNVDCVWNLQEAGGGNLLNAIAFKQMESLRGGTAGDHFRVSRLGTLTDLVDGGAGDNVLDYSLSTVAVTVNLNAAVPSGTNLPKLADSFSLLIGTNFNDILRGSTLRGMVINGSGGSDQIYGGNGRDILIGGIAVDQVFGGGGEDILVGGRVAYDGVIEGLLAIQREWSRTDLGYMERRANLRGQTAGGLNGTYYLRSRTSSSDPLPGTLPEDNAVDALMGQLDRDWFLASEKAGVVDTTSDRQANASLPNFEEKELTGIITW
jgi:parallel beta-helix repeat protein